MDSETKPQMETTRLQRAIVVRSNAVYHATLQRSKHYGKGGCDFLQLYHVDTADISFPFYTYPKSAFLLQRSHEGAIS